MHPVDVVDRDRAAAAEEDHQYRQADGGLGGGDGQDEHREHLAGQVAEKSRERDEVDVHGEQDQLDRHQHQDDVAAIEEDAEHADREQDRGHGEIMGQADHRVIPSPTSGSVSLIASPGRRASWREIFCGRVSRRLRCVRTIAPIIATSRISPAISNGNR